MIRWAALAAAVVLLGAGVAMFLLRPSDRAEASPATPTRIGDLVRLSDDTPAPTADAATREQRRFSRYDKDKDSRITREEYLASRHKAFTKLDANHDGRLSFEEWAAKAVDKFQAADADRNGAMSVAEFASTAVKRKTPARPRCACPEPKETAAAEDN